jgi:hypothetical protein
MDPDQTSLTVCEIEEIDPETVDSALESKASLGRRRGWCWRGLRCLLYCPLKLVSILDFSLFRSPLFRLLLVYCTTSPFVNISLDYLPALATEYG